jgi:site-specific recombinase XerD
MTETDPRRQHNIGRTGIQWRASSVLYLARHECGTKICREKGIEYARRLLGHTNSSTTQRYMHLDDRELADAQDLVD